MASGGEEVDDLFERDRVQELETEDFALTSVDGLVLSREGCSIVLFYDDSDESSDLREIWIDLADQFSGINFCAVNTTKRRNIMKRILQIQNTPNHPLWKYLNKMSYPFILAFREVEPGLGYPQAVYNGSKNYDDLSDWASNSACQEGYNEYPSSEEDEDATSSPNYDKQNARVRRVLADRERELNVLAQTPDQYVDMPAVVSIPDYGRSERTRKVKDASFYDF
jgi:hypothetical protein